MGRRAFARFAWFFVGYLVAVILFGAWVRITHSGAGCGNHWPTCNGEVLPAAPAIETVIEYTHRLTSGMCGVFGLILIGWAVRLFGWTHLIVRTSLLTMLFIIFEALIGAGLVLGELVAGNDSVARAVVVALHLSNTLILMACASLTAWFAGQDEPYASGTHERSPLLPALGLLALVVIAMSGAVTALGDTLFPISATLGPGLFEKVQADLSPANHFLVRLRIGHPILALLGSLFVGWLLLSPVQRTAGWARAAMALLIAELAVGLWNVAWAAPGWLQIIHLLLAQALWICTLIAFAPIFFVARRERAPESAGRPVAVA